LLACCEHGAFKQQENDENQRGGEKSLVSVYSGEARVATQIVLADSGRPEENSDFFGMPC
jgi:hypothetical protein